MQVTDGLTAADAGLTDVVNMLQQGNWGTYFTPGTDTYHGGNVWGDPGTYYGWNTAGSGQYRVHLDPCSIMSSSRQLSSGCNANTDLVATVQGQYPANTGSIQTIQAVIRNQAGGPAAFNFAMFADKGVQVHHHGDSYISPTIVTTQIHSNGFITLNYPATYRVGEMEASGTITIADGGGSIPKGSVTAPYNWAYWISGTDTTNPARCYPALQYPSLQYPTPGTSNAYWAVPTGSGTSSSCSGDPQWSQHAVVIGDVNAKEVDIKSNGAVKQPACETVDQLTGASVSATCPSAGGNQWTPEAFGTGCGGTGQAGFIDPITGSCIKDDAGNVTAGTVKFLGSGQTFTGPAGTQPTDYTYASSAQNCTLAGDTNCNNRANNTGGLASCTACNKGPTDTAGAIGGQVNLQQASWAPASVPFPSFNFTDPTYGTLPVAETESGNASTSTATCTTGSTCHVFSTGSFLNWMETAGNEYYPGAGITYDPNVNVCPTGWCMTWLTSAKQYTNLPGSVAYVVLRGNYELTGGGNLSMSVSGLRSGFGVSNTAVTPTVMVAGALVNETGGINLTASLTVVGPTMDPFSPMLPDSSLPQGIQTVPGLLASGAKGTAIQSTDYDTDSAYTSASNYQSLYRNTVIVRGLVYTGTWSTSALASTASDQHWHNADPKNAQIIVGAQIGGLLHDCNNFTFSYDPLIQNLKGFSGSTSGGIYVVDWTQL